MPTKVPALGIDLGGTKLSAAVVCDLQLITEQKKVPTPKGAGNIVQAILDLIEEFRGDHLLAGVGIATAGIVNVDTGEVIGSTGNLPGWEGTAIKKIVESKTMLPVHVENDANAAAYGEYRAGSFSDQATIVTVTLGTGIGVGIVINGKLYRGDHFAAGECGHIRIGLENKRLCTCGLFDCWETYGSGRGLVATGRELLRNVTAVQTDLATKGDALTTEDILAAATRGEVIAKGAMTIWHEHVCAGLTILAHTLDPSCFLITGGMSSFVDYDLLRELFADRTLKRIGENVQILPSRLGKAAGMIGAAELVLDHVLAGQRR